MYSLVSTLRVVDKFPVFLSTAWGLSQMCRFGVLGGLLTNREWGTFLVDDYVYGEIMFLLALDVCVQEASTTSHKGHGLEGGWTLAAVLFQDTTPSVASGCSWLLAVTLG